MNLQTIASYIIGCGFGLWWAFFPQSVVRFYTWFHNGKGKMPKLIAIRVMGVLWTIFFIVISNCKK
jgi:hypothetical protein